MGPKSIMTGVLIGRREETYRHTRRMSHYSGGRGCSDMSTSQGASRLVGNHQKLGGGKEGVPPTGFRGSMALLTSCFQLVDSRTVREENSVVLR